MTREKEESEKKENNLKEDSEDRETGEKYIMEEEGKGL